MSEILRNKNLLNPDHQKCKHDLISLQFPHLFSIRSSSGTKIEWYLMELAPLNILAFRVWMKIGDMTPHCSLLILEVLLDFFLEFQYWVFWRLLRVWLCLDTDFTSIGKELKKEEDLSQWGKSQKSFEKQDKNFKLLIDSYMWSRNTLHTHITVSVPAINIYYIKYSSTLWKSIS